MGDLTEHFASWEFECGCGCGLVILNDNLIEKLEAARVHAGIPFTINSGTRCPRHNKAVGGVDNSSHRTGLAADIRMKDSTERYKILGGLYYAGFKRIKLGGAFVHTDVDVDKVQEWFGL